MLIIGAVGSRNHWAYVDHVEAIEPRKWLCLHPEIRPADVKRCLLTGIILVSHGDSAASVRGRAFSADPVCYKEIHQLLSKTTYHTICEGMMNRYQHP